METELGLERQTGFGHVSKGMEVEGEGSTWRKECDQSSVAQEETQGRGPGTPRAESDLGVAVSGKAPEDVRDQQGFKMTSQPTGKFQRGQREMAAFLQGWN